MKNESPFLDIKSFVAEEVQTDVSKTLVPTSSPFLSLFESEDANGVHPDAAKYVTFLNQIYDREFEEALASLVDEAATLFEAQFPSEREDSSATGYQAERMLTQHFAPLVSESEAMFEALDRQINQRGTISMSEEEINTLVDQYQASSSLSPTFEDFWGGLKNLAKKAISAAATLGLGPILNKLKGLIKPLLKKVIQTAIHKLPIHLQPYAKQLIDKVPFLKEFEERDEAVMQNAKSHDTAELLLEFDQQVANLVFARSEVDQELEMSRVLAAQASPDVYPLTG
jgi:hypothetical protein